VIDKNFILAEDEDDDFDQKICRYQQNPGQWISKAFKKLNKFKSDLSYYADNKKMKKMEC